MEWMVFFSGGNCETFSTAAVAKIYQRTCEPSTLSTKATCKRARLRSLHLAKGKDARGRRMLPVMASDES